MVWIGVVVGGTAYFRFRVHLIVAILMSENCVAFLQSDSNTYRKVIIHVPLQIKHLTRTVVKVIEKPIVEEHKHDGEIIHHHRHFGHVEHDHSHDVRGSPSPSPSPPHEHRMDEENSPIPTAATSDAGSRPRPRPRQRQRQRQRLRPHAEYVNLAEEPITSRKARPATQTRRFPNNATYDRMPSPSSIRRHRYLTAARARAGAGVGTGITPNFRRPRPFSPDPYVRVLFSSS